MPTYMYKAMTKQGQMVKNKMNEINKINCIKKLRRNDLIPISVVQTIRLGRKEKKKPKNFKLSNFKKKNIGNQLNSKSAQSKEKLSLRQRIIKKIDNEKKVSYRDIKIFTQNFYLLKKANFNNVHALSTVMESTENPRLKVIIEDILYGVEAGETMYSTMEYYSDIFPYIYVNMIKVGELSGSLEISLSQAIKYLDESEALKTKLKRILVPNIAMFIGILLMLIICVVIGVPAIQNIFDSIGTSAELPWITLWFARVVNRLGEIWYIPLMIIAAIAGGIAFWVHTPNGKYKFDTFKYTMPIFGKLIYLVDFSRLLKNMLLNLQNGIRIQDALEVSKSVIKNTVMTSMIDVAISNIYIGQSWIEPFEKAKFANSMTVEMLKVGMKTDLTEMMEKLLVYMDMDIDNALERIMKVLPEVAYAIVGIVLIFFVVVVLVPCIQIYMGGFLFSAYGL